MTAMSFPLTFHVTAADQFALLESRHTPALSLRTMSPARGAVGFPAAIGGEKPVPAFGGGLGSPAYGFTDDETTISGMMVVSLPHSAIAAYTRVPSVASARGSSPLKLISVGAVASALGL